jgi:hypothetical protein
MGGWMDESARPGVTAIRVAKHTQVTNHFISPALAKQSIAYVSFDVGRDHITEKDFKPDHAIANNRSLQDETTRALKSMVAGEALARRLFLPVRPHVDLTTTRPALGAHDLARKRRDLGVGRIL